MTVTKMITKKITFITNITALQATPHNLATAIIHKFYEHRLN